MSALGVLLADLIRSLEAMLPWITSDSAVAASSPTTSLEAMKSHSLSITLSRMEMVVVDMDVVVESVEILVDTPTTVRSLKNSKLPLVSTIIIPCRPVV